MAGKFELYKEAAGKYRFRLKAGNGQIIAAGEAYETKANALNGTSRSARAPPTRPWTTRPADTRSARGGPLRPSLIATCCCATRALRRALRSVCCVRGLTPRCSRTNPASCAGMPRRRVANPPPDCRRRWSWSVEFSGVR